MPITEVSHHAIQGSRLGAATRLLRSLSLAVVLASGLVAGLSASTASASSGNPTVAPTFGPGDHAPVIGKLFPSAKQTIAFYAGAKSRRELSHAALTSSTHKAPGKMHLYARGSGGGEVLYSVWPGYSCDSAITCQNGFGQVCSVGPYSGVVQFYAAGTCVIAAFAEPNGNTRLRKNFLISPWALFRTVSAGAPVTAPEMVPASNVSTVLSTITATTPSPADWSGLGGAGVTVTLRDKAGNPIVDAPISLTGVDPRRIAAATGFATGPSEYSNWVLTDASGQAVFVVGGVAAGTLRIGATVMMTGVHQRLEPVGALRRCGGGDGTGGGCGGNGCELSLNSATLSFP